MFCSQCETSLPDGSRFCTQCGNALPPPVVSPAEVTTKKGNHKSSLILGLCAGIVLIAGIVIGALFLFPGKETVYLLTCQTQYAADGHVISSVVYDYDDHGRLICTQLQNKDGKVFRQFRMEYDEYGNRTLEASEISRENSGPSLSLETVYDFSYDEDGRVEECEFSKGASAPEITCQFSYDEDNNLILVEWDTEDLYSAGPYWQYYEYDRNGNLTAEYFCNLVYYAFTPDAASQVMRNTYEYDNNGNLIEIATAFAQIDKRIAWDDLPDLDFEMKQRWEYEFDSRGRLCAADGESLEYDENGNLLVEGYVFDEHGNLICEEHSNGSRTEYTYVEQTLSRADAQLAERQKSCLPAEFTNTTYVYSLDPLKPYLYPLGFKGNLFYDYMIPHPVW